MTSNRLFLAPKPTTGIRKVLFPVEVPYPLTSIAIQKNSEIVPFPVSVQQFVANKLKKTTTPDNRILLR